MAKIAAKNSMILIDGLRASGWLNSYEVGLEQATPEVNGFETAGPERVIDNYDYSFSFQGFFDGAEDTHDQIIAAARDDDDHHVSVVFGGDSAGNRARSGSCKMASDPRSGSTGAAVLLNHEWQGSDELIGGQLLYTNESVTDTDDGTGIEQGTTTAGDVYAVVVHVVGGTFSSLTVAIQQSSDDGDADAYETISGMTNEFSDVGAVRLETTAATEAWKRVSVTGFTGTSAEVHVIAGTVAGV